MKNFVKIANLIILSFLALALLGLHRKFGEVEYINGFNYILIIISVYLAVISFETITSIFKFAIKLIKKTNTGDRRRSDTIGETSFLEKLWEEFVETSPIATIIINQDNVIVRKNHSFEKIVDKFKKADVENISEFIDVSPSEIKKDKGFEKFSIHEVKIKNEAETPFTIFAANYEERKSMGKTWLIQFIDNSEKTELKEKFIQAQKMQAIGQLAGGVAHDFNNLLTAIIGFCDLMLTRHAPGEQDFVDIMQVKQNANRAANLVRQLLAFSRKQTMQMEIIDLNEVTSEISNLLRRLIGENISLQVNQTQNLWDVKADKSQLEQVIINLAVNARDAIEETGIISVETENIEIISMRDFKFNHSKFTGNDDLKAGKYVMITITDSGSGIKESNLKKIFEPFFTTKQLGEGTGLGLSTVAGIIEQSEGYIYVSSEEELGTSFYIFLKKADKSKEIATEEVKEKEVYKDLTGSGTILLIEDEDPVRMFSKRALSDKGYNVLEAYCGENALEVVAEYGVENIDLVLSDVVMPGLSGPEVVEKLVEMKPDIKVIFVSGYGEDAFYQKYGKERKFNFLPKPYTLNQIASKVKELI